MNRLDQQEAPIITAVASKLLSRSLLCRWFDVNFTLDEEPISFDEVGELLDVLQKKLIDPASDIAPEGYEPFIEIGS